jgi:hypothetical protein
VGANFDMCPHFRAVIYSGIVPVYSDSGR